MCQAAGGVEGSSALIVYTQGLGIWRLSQDTRIRVLPTSCVTRKVWAQCKAHFLMHPEQQHITVQDWHPLLMQDKTVSWLLMREEILHTCHAEHPPANQ